MPVNSICEMLINTDYILSKMTKGEQDSHINGSCTVSSSIADQLYENTSDDNDSHKQASGDEQKVVGHTGTINGRGSAATAATNTITSTSTSMSSTTTKSQTGSVRKRTRAERAAKCALVATKAPPRRVARTGKAVVSRSKAKANGELVEHRRAAATATLPQSFTGQTVLPQGVVPAAAPVTSIRVKPVESDSSRTSSSSTTELRRSQRLNSTDKSTLSVNGETLPPASNGLKLTIRVGRLNLNCDNKSLIDRNNNHALPSGSHCFPANHPTSSSVPPLRNGYAVQPTPVALINGQTSRRSSSSSSRSSSSSSSTGLGDGSSSRKRPKMFEGEATHLACFSSEDSALEPRSPDRRPAAVFYKKNQICPPKNGTLPELTMPTATTSAFHTITPVHKYKKKKKKKKRSRGDSKLSLLEQSGPTLPKRITFKYGFCETDSLLIDVEKRNLQKAVKRRKRAPKCN